MTIKELKNQHPEIYKAIQDEARQKEKNRIEGLMKFSRINPTAVKKAIKTNTPIPDSVKDKAVAKALQSVILTATKSIKKNSSKNIPFPVITYNIQQPG